MSFLTLSGLVISFSSTFTQDDKTYENDHLELDQPPRTLSTRHKWVSEGRSGPSVLTQAVGSRVSEKHLFRKI